MFWKKKANAPSAPTHLPPPDRELVPRSAREVAERLLAILAVVGRTHKDPPDKLKNWVSENEIAEFFSPSEIEYFASADPSHAAKVAFSWRSEGAVSLIWALGGLAEFPPLRGQFSIYDVEMVRAALKAPKTFLASAQLRELAELQEQEDRLCHEHWRVRDAQLFDREMPAELDPGIVYERRYALSWLVGYGDDWDDVPTDT